jgi:hypothetical protein
VNENAPELLKDTPDVQLYFSNLNLPEYFIATAGVASYRRIMDEINDDTTSLEIQYEITPTRRLALDSLLGQFDNQAGERPFAGRLHQTWPRGLIEGTLHAPSARSAVINGIAYLMMPGTRGSLKTLERMNRQLGTVPTVVYADQKDGSEFLVSATQISPELMTVTGALQPYDYHRLHDSLGSRGVNGLIIDNHHLVRAADNDPQLHLEWEQLLDDVEQAGTGILGAHASAGRVDSKHSPDRSRSQTELAAIFGGPAAIGETIMGRVLARSYEIWRGQNESVQTAAGFPLTIEIPYRGMVAHADNKRLRMPELVSMHRDVARSLGEYVGNLRQVYDETNMPPDLG